MNALWTKTTTTTSTTRKLLLLFSSHERRKTTTSKRLTTTCLFRKEEEGKRINNIRQFSTAAIQQQQDDDENNNDEQRAKNRPRLAALRKQLANEQSSFMLFQNQQQQQTTTTSPSSINNNNNSTLPSSSSSSSFKQQQQESSLTSPPQIIVNQNSASSNSLLLKDRFEREHSYLRISLTERCNLRCLYCMPEEGVSLQPSSHLLTKEELLQLTSLFVQHGVDKIRFTGGEPLLRHDDLLYLITHLKQNLDVQHIGMTTNGITLSRHLPSLVDAGLTHVNISLDSLVPEKFARLTRRTPQYLDKVYQSIIDASRLLPETTKVNMVVMRNENVDEMVDFCRLSETLGIDVRFIEWMPFSQNQWNSDTLVEYREMMEIITSSSLELERIVDGPNDTTKWWQIKQEQTTSNNHRLGRIGFITSMSQHFCGTCNRLRLMADGQLKACLFGSTEVNLRNAIRQQQQDDNNNDNWKDNVENLIRHALQQKHYALGGHGTPQGIADKSNENRPMTTIGG